MALIPNAVRTLKRKQFRRGKGKGAEKNNVSQTRSFLWIFLGINLITLIRPPT